jgi:hypothetical protein
MEIVTKITHSKERAKDFYRFHLLKISPAKYVYFGLSLILFIGFLVLILIRNYYNALFLLFISVLVLIIRIVTINITVSKIIKNLSFPSTNYILKFSNDFVIYQLDTVKKQYKWNELMGVYETENYMLFYITTNSALILPKYSIQKEEREALKSMIKSSGIKYKISKFK